MRMALLAKIRTRGWAKRAKIKPVNTALNNSPINVSVLATKWA
jgi:hypothetical protein